MATTEERLAKLEGGAAAAGWDGFGPPVNNGGELWPSEPVTADGTTPLPWNAQAGDAGQQVFRGAVSIPLVSSPGFTGVRYISASQLPPQFDQVGIRLDGDAAGVQGSPFIGTAQNIPIWFADGAARTLHITPTGNDQAAGGCGRVQFVGGIPA